MKYLPNLLGTCNFTHSGDFHKLLSLRFVSLSYDIQLEMGSFFGSEPLLIIYSTRHILILGNFITVLFPYFLYENVLLGHQ